MVVILSARPQDLSATAELHRRHLKLGLFPQLGRRFLAAYHESFMQSPHGIALVAQAEGEIVGVLLGTTSSADHNRWVIRNRGFRLAWHGGRSLLFQPRLGWRFLTTRLGRYAKGLRRHLSRKNSSARTGKRAACVLSHIVTSGKARNRGVGRQLVERFKKEALERGAHRARLITRENGPGVPFFERIGCECVDTRKEQDGSSVREYQLALEEAIDERTTPVGRLRRRYRDRRATFRAGGDGRRRPSHPGR